MSDSDATSSAKGAAIGKPPDLCWGYYSTLPGPANPLGIPTVQSANKRAHRKCNGCGTVLHSCTVVSGTAHLFECAKAKTMYPDMVSTLEDDKLRKLNKKEQGSRLKRSSGTQGSLATHLIPVPAQEERHGIMKALLDMLIMCNIAFRVVDSPWFRRFCRHLRPGFVPACGFAESASLLLLIYCCSLLFTRVSQAPAQCGRTILTASTRRSKQP